MGWQTVFENSLIEHHIALPPGAMGKISYIAPEGEYSIEVGLSYIITTCHFHVIQQMLDVMLKLCGRTTSCVYQGALSSSITYICCAFHSYFIGELS